MMTIRGFNARTAAELEALRRECAASNHVESICAREAIAYVAAKGQPGAPHAFLRLQIASGYARRRGKSAA